MVSIAENLRSVMERIRAAESRAGKPEGSVTLMGVVKTRTPEQIATLVDAGVTCLGENRIQEAEDHLDALPGVLLSPCRLHFIGRLQSNKARKAVKLFHSIDSIDSEKLVRRADRICGEETLTREVMLEVNTGGEAQKGGIVPKEARELAALVKECPHLTLTGLMTVPPFLENAEACRPYFAELRSLFEAIADDGAGPAFRHLSMGMTHDMEVAVEEGATMVRVGTALFGPRRTP